MSLQKSIDKRFSSMNKQVDKLVADETAINLVRVGLILYALFVPSLPDDVIYVFFYFGVRLVITLLIAFMLFKDVITALLLAVCFVISIQELNKRFPVIIPIKPNSPSYDMANNAPMMNLNDTGSMVENVPVPQVMNNNPEDVPDPAFQTLTENVISTAFTSDSQFRDAQSNMVQGADPDAGVKTFVKQQGAQGLDAPIGFDPVASKASAV